MGHLGIILWVICPQMHRGACSFNRTGSHRANGVITLVYLTLQVFLMLP